MKSDVELACGLSCWIVLTGTPLFDEITPNVSPACTVQNRCPAVLAVAVVVRAFVVTAFVVFAFAFAFVVVTCRRGAVGTEVVVSAFVRPDSSPDRTRRIAIVAASRNAAGPTYRRQSRSPATSRTRSRSAA
jgi:hypothetical protein